MPGRECAVFRFFKISVMILDARIGPNLAGFSASVGRTSEVVPSFECETTRVSSEAMSRASRTPSAHLLQPIPIGSLGARAPDVDI